jgi:hypothetical protein
MTISFRSAFALLTTGAVIAGCSGGGAIVSRPSATLKLSCTSKTWSSGRLSVNVSCQGLTPSGFALRSTLTATMTAPATHVSASGNNGSVAVAAMSSNTFSVMPMAAGTAVIKLQDDAGDEVAVDENVTENTESPEPSETPASPEPSETPEPAESGEPSEAPESPEPSETPASPEPSESPD